MAVARIKLTARQHLVLAAALPPSLHRAAREIKRAAERPGLLAELTADEVRAIQPHAVGDAAQAVAAAVALVAEVEAQEQAGIRNLRADLDARWPGRRRVC